jgi:hypothetical protein
VNSPRLADSPGMQVVQVALGRRRLGTDHFIEWAVVHPIVGASARMVGALQQVRHKLGPLGCVVGWAPGGQLRSAQEPPTVPFSLSPSVVLLPGPHPGHAEAGAADLGGCPAQPEPDAGTGDE